MSSLWNPISKGLLPIVSLLTWLMCSRDCCYCRGLHAAVVFAAAVANAADVAIAVAVANIATVAVASAMVVAVPWRTLLLWL